MITAIVRFALPQPLTPQAAKEAFLATAPRYRDLEGLVRKYYILSEDGCTAGGVYLWRSREDAERAYSPQWRDFVREKYGCEPLVECFASPVVVDNLAGAIVTDDSTPVR